MSQMVDQVNGYDVYAKRAECDEDGNNIKSTYAKTANLPVTDVTVDGSSVVNNGTAAITLPKGVCIVNSSDTASDAAAVVASAIAAGKQVFYHRTGTTEDQLLPLADYTTSGSSLTFYRFAGCTANDIFAHINLSYNNGEWVWNNYYARSISNSSLLPSHSASDSGKSLTVGSNGSAVWTVPNDVFYFTSSNDAAADKAAIDAAIAAGKKPVLKYVDGNYTFELPLMLYRDTEIYRFSNNDYYRFVSRSLKYSDNAWSWESIFKKVICPNYSSSDDESVLTISSSTHLPVWEHVATAAEIQAIVV